MGWAFLRFGLEVVKWMGGAQRRGIEASYRFHAGEPYEGGDAGQKGVAFKDLSRVFRFGLRSADPGKTYTKVRAEVTAVTGAEAGMVERSLTFHHNGECEADVPYDAKEPTAFVNVLQADIVGGKMRLPYGGALEPWARKIEAVKPFSIHLRIVGGPRTERVKVNVGEQLDAKWVTGIETEPPPWSFARYRQWLMEPPGTPWYAPLTLAAPERRIWRMAKDIRASLGAGGRRFESSRPDHLPIKSSGPLVV